MPEGSERQGDTTKWYFISAWPQEFLNLQMYLWRKILMQQQPSTFSVVAGASSVVSWPPDGLLYCWHAHMPSQRDLWAVDHMVRMEPRDHGWEQPWPRTLPKSPGIHWSSARNYPQQQRTHAYQSHHKSWYTEHRWTPLHCLKCKRHSSSLCLTSNTNTLQNANEHQCLRTTKALQLIQASG